MCDHPRTRRKRKRLNVKRGRSIAGKIAVMALLDRHGKDGVSQVRTEVLSSLRKQHVQGHVRDHVEAGSNLHTDSFFSYTGLASDITVSVSRWKWVRLDPGPGPAEVILRDPRALYDLVMAHQQNDTPLTLADVTEGS